MKKIIRIVKNNILGIVIGVLLGLTLDVAAETIIDSGGVSYSNSKTSETTVDGALDELFSAIDISKQIGTTDISSIGDGTITGAISNINNTISEINGKISSLNSHYTGEPHFYISRGRVEKLKTRYLIYGTIGCDSTTVSANTNTLIGTLDFAPFETVMTPLVVTYGGNVITNGVLLIDTEGKMYINLPVATNYIVASFTTVIYTE